MKKFWQSIKRLPARLRRGFHQKYQRDGFPPLALTRPLLADYSLIAACQMSCEFCDIWVRENYLQPPPVEFHQHLPALGKLASAGVIWLNLTFGEPLLYPFLPEFLAAAREQSFQIALTSNGLLLPDLLPRIKGQVDRLFLKIFAPEAKDHDRICGLKDSWDQVIAATVLAKKAGLPVAWKFPLNRSSLAYLPDMINLAKQKKIRLHLWFWPNKPPWGGFDQESLAYIRRCLPFPYVRLNNAQLSWFKKNQPGRPNRSGLCRAQAAALTVGPDGRFILPCFYQALTRVGPEAVTINQGQIRFVAPEPVKPDPEICAVCQAEEYVVPSIWQRRDLYFLKQIHSSLLDRVKGD